VIGGTLPICGPAEVRAVQGIPRFRSLKDNPGSFTLHGNWKPIVHRSREECPESLRQPMQAP